MILALVIDWTSVLVGVGSSLIASILFIFLLSYLRPSVRISDKIARVNYPEADVTVYVFKVMNCSPFFKMYDVKFNLRIYKKRASPNGEDRSRVHKDASLVTDYYPVIDKFNLKHVSQWVKPRKKVTSRTDYAAQIGSHYDLDDVIAKDCIVRIQVIAKHSLSGFSKVIAEEYSHDSHIETGTFCSGNSFEIVP